MQCVITSEDPEIDFFRIFTCTIKTSKKLHSYFLENDTMESQESSANTEVENPLTADRIS